MKPREVALGEPPSEVMFPLITAPVEVTLVAAVVVTVGIVAQAGVVNDDDAGVAAVPPELTAVDT